MYIRANMNIHALTRGMRNDEKVVGLHTCFFSSEYIYTYTRVYIRATCIRGHFTRARPAQVPL